jgi:hypothetical protein
MAEKSGNGTGRTGSKGDDQGVLASLPSTRPARLSRRGRDGEKPAPKAAAKAKPKARAKPKAKAKAKPKAAAPTPTPTPIAAAADKQRPQPVRAGHPTLARKPAEGRAEDPGQSGLDLVKTVVQAAGEVAQIGATVGGQILKRAVDKLPKRP